MIARRNNNFRHVDDTTLMAASEEKVKSLLMRVKDKSEKTGLKLNIQKKNKTKQKTKKTTVRLWHPVPSLYCK